MSRLSEFIRRCWVLGLALVGFFATVTAGLLVRSPLGHDESVYALRGRDILEHGWAITSGDYWQDYRAPGLPVLIAGFGQLLGVQATAARAIVALFGAVSIVLTWWIVGRIANRAAADVSAMLLATTTGFTVTSSTLLADVPGTAFSLGAVACYLRDLEHGRLRSSLVLVPLLAFAGTATRFGTPFPLAAGLLGITLVFAPSAIRSRNWILYGQVVFLGCATAMTCALVVFTDLLSLNGRTPAEANRTLVTGNQLTPGSGLRDLRMVVDPTTGGAWYLWSTAVAALFAIGIVLAILGAALRRVHRPPVVGLAVAGTVSLGGVVVGVGQVQPNYLVLTLPYWAGLAGVGLAWPLRTGLRHIRRSGARPAILSALAALTVVLLFDTGSEVRATHHDYLRSWGRIRSTSLDVRATWGEPCIIVTSYTPQVGYYSGCAVAPFGPVEEGLDHALATQIDLLQPETTPPTPAGVFLREVGKRQPSSEQIDQATFIEPTRIFVYGTEGERGRHVWIQPIRRCVLAGTC